MNKCMDRVIPEKRGFPPAFHALYQGMWSGNMSERKPYWQLLRDPRWQKKRLEVMDAAKFTCEHCGEDGSTLNVHHKLYRKGAMPWDYEAHELQCLCEDCHSVDHALSDQLKEALALCNQEDIADVYGYAIGILIRTGRCPTETISPRTWDVACGLTAALHDSRCDWGFTESLCRDGIPTSELRKHANAVAYEFLARNVEGFVDGQNSHN